MPLLVEPSETEVYYLTNRALTYHARHQYKLAARYYACTAELLFRWGFDQEAYETYERAFRALLEAEWPDAGFPEELHHISLRLVDICIQRGDYELGRNWIDGTVARVQCQATENGEPEPQFSDHILAIRASVTRANERRSMLFWTHTASSDALLELRELYRSIYADVGRVADPPRSISPWVGYNHWCMEAAFDPHQARYQLGLLKDRMEEWTWFYGYVRCRLAEIKLTLIIGDCPEESKISFYEDVLETGYTCSEEEFVRILGSSRLAVEAFVTAAVCAIRFGLEQGIIDERLDHLTELLAQINRQDILAFVLTCDNESSPAANLLWLLAE